jgi:hypothetical protein
MAACVPTLKVTTERIMKKMGILKPKSPGATKATDFSSLGSGQYSEPSPSAEIQAAEMQTYKEKNGERDSI